MKAIITLYLFLFVCSNLNAQEKANSEINYHKNYLSAYIGFFEYNFNYERNLFLFPKSYTNIRLGFGEWSDAQGGGNTYNLTCAHLFGRRSSHLELNLGLIFLNGKTKYGNGFYPNGYVGYRYEKLDGRIVIRAGISSWSIFNVGLGLKF